MVSEKDQANTIIAQIITTIKEQFQCDLNMQGLSNMVNTEINARVEEKIAELINKHDLQTLINISDQLQYHLANAEKAKRPVKKVYDKPQH